MTITLYSTPADKRAINKLKDATVMNETPITIENTDRIDLLYPDGLDHVHVPPLSSLGCTSAALRVCTGLY